MQPAGKSSVLQAILNKMVVAKGSLEVGGHIAYVPQSPWVQNLSLRNNILFGMPYDEAKYRDVIHACALELDLNILPKGELAWGLKSASGRFKHHVVWKAASDLIQPLSEEALMC